MRSTTNRQRFAVAVVAAALMAPAPVDAAGARLFKSGPIQITADGASVWVVNPDHDSVTRIDTATATPTEHPLPNPLAKDVPRGLSLREDGSEIWVACHDSDRVYVLDAAGAELARIDFPWGSGPYSVALSRDQLTAIVTLHRGAGIAVVDVATRSIAHILPSYHSPTAVAWTEAGDEAWVTHIFADGEHPFLTRLSLAASTPKVVSQIRALPAQPQRDTQDGQGLRPTEGGYLTHRGHLAQIPSPTGRLEMWLPTQYNNIHNDSWAPDSTVQSTMRRLDIATRALPDLNTDKVIFTAVEVHDPKRTNPGLHQGPGWDARVSGPIDIAFSTDGAMGYVVHELSNDVLVFPTSTPAVKPAGPPLDEVAVGARPVGIAYSPASDLAYVANLLSRDVSVLDLGQSPPVEVGRVPVSPTGSEPLAAAVLRGAELFHTSADPRISANDKVSCASCHINAEHDGRSWSFQNLPGNHGNRSVQTLLGLNRTFGAIDPATGYGQLHLSGDRDEIQDFEHTFRGVNFGGTGFLGSTACPDVNPPDPMCRNAGRDADLDAIAAYMLSLEPIARSPYRDPVTGGLSEAAIRGYTFFVGADRANKAADAGCAGCHLPPTGPTEVAVFADLQFHDIGYRPGGEQEFTTQRGNDHRMNTQPLVGAWASPPWEGTSNWPRSSMIEVLKEMAGRASAANPHGTPDGLTGRQLRDLEAFIKSIDGHMTGAELNGLADLTPPRIVRVEPASLGQVDVWFSESVDPATSADPANYRLHRLGGGDVPIASGSWHPNNGDRVTLDVALEDCATYVLAPIGGILDAAASATGGVANSIDLAAVGNVQSFTIDGQITITAGVSGYENLTIPMHDGAMVGQSHTNWGHDSIYLAAGNGPPIGFVRFEFEPELARVTGITVGAEIVNASFSMVGSWGDAQELELRRMLLAWSDPATNNDWDNGPPGLPTWASHAHGVGSWNQAGARALGGDGKSVGDYNGSFNRAATVDLTITPPVINNRVLFAGPEVTDAFRFWFDNRTAVPAVNHGYAFEIVNGAQELRFERWEHELGEHGGVLTITYALPPLAAPGEVSGRGSGTPLYVVKDASGELLFSFEDTTDADLYNIYEGAIGGWYSHTGAACGLTVGLSAGRRETLHATPASDTYFVVTGSSCSAEGPSDLDHPPLNLDCPN